MLKRLTTFEKEYKLGLISKEHILDSMRGWNAYASTANTYNLRTMVNKKIAETINFCHPEVIKKQTFI